MHSYAVRTTAPHLAKATAVAASRMIETSSPVRVRSGARKVSVKASEIFPSPILS